MKKRVKIFLTTVLATTGLLMASMTVAAAEPEDRQEPQVAEAVEGAVLLEESEAVEAEDTTALPDGSEAVEAEDATALPDESEAIEAVSPRSASGYAADYTDYNIDSFTIPVSGSSSSGVAYMKAWDFSGSPSIYVSLYRPNGSVVFTDVKLPIGTEISKSFSNLSAGTYTLRYSVAGTSKGWIYCRLNG